MRALASASSARAMKPVVRRAHSKPAISFGLWGCNKPTYLIEHALQGNGEQGAAEPRPRDDERHGQSASLVKPLRGDREAWVEDQARGEAEEHTLREDELVILDTYWVFVSFVSGGLRESQHTHVMSTLGRGRNRWIPG
jgi:hypothetical protein